MLNHVADGVYSNMHINNVLLKMTIALKIIITLMHV